MLRYVEESGLVVPPRSAAGYRLYGPAELQRLRTLRELVGQGDIELSDVSFALRLRDDRTLRTAVDSWLSAEATRPGEVDPSEWLAYEQEKHARLLLATAATTRATELRDATGLRDGIAGAGQDRPELRTEKVS